MFRTLFSRLYKNEDLTSKTDPILSKSINEKQEQNCYATYTVLHTKFASPEEADYLGVDHEGRTGIASYHVDTCNNAIEHMKKLRERHLESTDGYDADIKNLTIHLTASDVPPGVRKNKDIIFSSNALATIRREAGKLLCENYPSPQCKFFEERNELSMKFSEEPTESKEKNNLPCEAIYAVNTREQGYDHWMKPKNANSDCQSAIAAIQKLSVDDNHTINPLLIRSYNKNIFFSNLGLFRHEAENILDEAQRRVEKRTIS